MRKILLVTTGLAWLALTGAASAGVTLTPGPMDPQYFAAEAAHQNGFTINGATWTDVSGVAETEVRTRQVSHFLGRLVKEHQAARGQLKCLNPR